MVGGHAWQGGVHGGGHVWQGGVCGKGACIMGGLAGGVCVAGETATAADGRNPTGMHSC